MNRKFLKFQMFDIKFIKKMQINSQLYKSL